MKKKPLAEQLKDAQALIEELKAQVQASQGENQQLNQQLDAAKSASTAIKAEAYDAEKKLQNEQEELRKAFSNAQQFINSIANMLGVQPTNGMLSFDEISKAIASLQVEPAEA